MKPRLIKLTAKTRKGKNRIREAGTDVWEITKGPQHVHFNKGLWVLITPDNGNRDHSRWVSFSSPDENFFF